MFNFNSFKLTAVLSVVYFLVILIISAFIMQQREINAVLVGTITGFWLTFTIKSIIGALVAWLIGRKIFTLACAFNITIIVLIVSEILSDIFIALRNV